MGENTWYFNCRKLTVAVAVFAIRSRCARMLVQQHNTLWSNSFHVWAVKLHVYMCALGSIMKRQVNSWRGGGS